jgi:hypothetical protein
MKLKIILSIFILAVGVVLSNMLLISRTEQLIGYVYTLSIILLIWRWKAYKFQFVFALLCISISVVLFVIGPTMIRYVHYVDKAATWSYYFFVTGIIFSCIDIFKTRLRKEIK